MWGMCKMIKVDVYRNLHKHTWSIRDRKTGKVIAHQDAVNVLDAKFVVQPAGRQRVLQEARKNVHAFVRGTLATYQEVLDDPRTFYLITPYIVRYNPYQAGHFFYHNLDNRIDKADMVELTTEGVVAWHTLPPEWIRKKAEAREIGNLQQS